jgi:hypothetical protein
MSASPVFATLLQMSGDNNTITIHRATVEFLDYDRDSASMLEQLLYWTPRSTNDRWIAKTDDEFMSELYLKQYSLRAARKNLEARGLIETRVKRFNGFPTVHYRVCADQLVEAWAEFCARKESQPTPLARIHKNDSAYTQERSYENARILTEITTETTTERTRAEMRESSHEDEQADGMIGESVTRESSRDSERERELSVIQESFDASQDEQSLEPEQVQPVAPHDYAQEYLRAQEDPIDYDLAAADPEAFFLARERARVKIEVPTNRTAEDMRQGTLDAIAKFEERRMGMAALSTTGIQIDVSKFPEGMRDLAQAWCESFGRGPTKRELGDWIAEFRNWRELEVNAALVPRAFELAVKGDPNDGERARGISVTRPGSITYAFDRLRLDAQGEVEQKHVTVEVDGQKIVMPVPRTGRLAGLSGA